MTEQQSGNVTNELVKPQNQLNRGKLLLIVGCVFSILIVILIIIVLFQVISKNNNNSKVNNDSNIPVSNPVENNPSSGNSGNPLQQPANIISQGKIAVSAQASSGLNLHYTAGSNVSAPADLYYISSSADPDYQSLITLNTDELSHVQINANWTLKKITTSPDGLWNTGILSYNPANVKKAGQGVVVLITDGEINSPLQPGGSNELNINNQPVNSALWYFSMATNQYYNLYKTANNVDYLNSDNVLVNSLSGNDNSVSFYYIPTSDYTIHNNQQIYNADAYIVRRVINLNDFSYTDYKVGIPNSFNSNNMLIGCDVVVTVDSQTNFTCTSKYIDPKSNGASASNAVYTGKIVADTFSNIMRQLEKDAGSAPGDNLTSPAINAFGYGIKQNISQFTKKNTADNAIVYDKKNNLIGTITVGNDITFIDITDHNKNSIYFVYKSTGQVYTEENLGYFDLNSKKTYLAFIQKTITQGNNSKDYPILYLVGQPVN